MVFAALLDFILSLLLITVGQCIEFLGGVFTIRLQTQQPLQRADIHVFFLLVEVHDRQLFQPKWLLFFGGQIFENRHGLHVFTPLEELLGMGLHLARLVIHERFIE